MRLGCLFRVTLMVCFSSTFMLSAPDTRETSLHQYDQYLLQGDFNRARQGYERAIQQGANLEADVARVRNIGLAFLNSSPPDLPNAIHWLETALRVDPRDDAIRAHLARALILSRNGKGAAEHYRILVDAHPQSADYVIALSTALRQAGSTDAALDALQTTTTRFPTLVAVRLEYARLLNFTRQFDQAKRQFQIVLAANPENVIAQVGVAKAISFQGDQQAAIVLYDRILRGHPGLYDAIVGKAFSLLWSGDLDQAHPLLQSAERRHPEDEEVRAALAAMPDRSMVTRKSQRYKERMLPSVLPPALAKPMPAPAANQRVVTPNAAAKFDSQHHTPDSEHSVGSVAITCAFIGCVLIVALSMAPSLARTRGRHIPALQESAFPAPEPCCGRQTEPLNAGSAATSGNSVDLIDAAAASFSLPNCTSHQPLTSADCPPASASGPDRPSSDRIQRPHALLVGGSASLIDREQQWLALDSFLMFTEPEWIPAIVRLVTCPPDLIVLNPASDDRWTSTRMFHWIAAHQRHLRDRTLVICSAGDTHDLKGGLGRPAQFLVEPLAKTQWRDAVREMLLKPFGHLVSDAGSISDTLERSADSR